MEETNGKRGSAGTSGWSGHADYGGYPGFKCKDEYPEHIKVMIKLRNESMGNDWWGAIRGRQHVSGGADTLPFSNEIARKQMDEVDKDLKLIEAKYQIVDEEINKQIEIFLKNK